MARAQVKERPEGTEGKGGRNIAHKQRDGGERSSRLATEINL